MEDLEKIEPKTKNFVGVIDRLGLSGKVKKILVIQTSETDNLKRAARNVAGVSITTAQRLNTYDILNARQLIFVKAAVEELSKRLVEN